MITFQEKAVEKGSSTLFRSRCRECDGLTIDPLLPIRIKHVSKVVESLYFRKRSITHDLSQCKMTYILYIAKLFRKQIYRMEVNDARGSTYRWWINLNFMGLLVLYDPHSCTFIITSCGLGVHLTCYVHSILSVIMPGSRVSNHPQWLKDHSNQFLCTWISITKSITGGLLPYKVPPRFRYIVLWVRYEVGMLNKI